MHAKPGKGQERLHKKLFLLDLKVIRARRKLLDYPFRFVAHVELLSLTAPFLNCKNFLHNCQSAHVYGRNANFLRILKDI